MKSRALMVSLLALMVASAQAAQSNRGTAEVVIKGKKISINYGRPSLRGRDMLSKATEGTVWRLGMNLATEIDTAADLDIAGKKLKAGKYSLWAKKTAGAGGQGTRWVLGFHPKTGIWGVPEMKEGYLAELPLIESTAPGSAEQLTITLAEDKGKGVIKIQWGTAVLTGTFGIG